MDTSTLPTTRRTRLSPTASAAAAGASIEIAALFDLPFNDLLYRAHSVHRENFDPNAVQLSTLLSIKTGGCPEDCGYCPQAARYHTGVENEEMLALDAVVAAARGQRQGCDAFLHGRGVARSEAARPRSRDRNGESGARAGHGNLRHARHAEGRPGRAVEGGRPRLLQPQPRYRAGVLRRNHHHARPRTTASTRWAKCAMPASMSAAAASSAWARRAARAPR